MELDWRQFEKEFETLVPFSTDIMTLNEFNEYCKDYINGKGIEPKIVEKDEKEAFELESTNVVMVTASGMIKKSPLNEYKR